MFIPVIMHSIVFSRKNNNVDKDDDVHTKCDCYIELIHLLLPRMRLIMAVVIVLSLPTLLSKICIYILMQLR